MKGVALELLSGPHDDPGSEVVGYGLLHGMPGESIHCKTIDEDEFSVAVSTSLKDDHDLQCPLEDEDVLTMNQAIGFIIRWPASDLRRANVDNAGPAVASAAEAPPEEEVTFLMTRAGAKKFKSPAKEKKIKSPVREKKRTSKTKDDGPNTRKRVGFSSPASEVRSPPPSPM